MKEMKLYLLSAEEAEKLTEEQRIAKYDGGPWCWWLRSPGDNRDHASYVSYGGYVLDCGNYVSSDISGVRPALRIKSSICNKLLKTEEGCLLFGRKSGSNEAIEWLLIKEDGEVSTLLSKDCFTAHCFNSKPEKGNDFVTSDLVKYMNTELLQACFSEDEQEKILLTPIEPIVPN